MNNIPPRDVAVFTEAIRLPAIERAGYLASACADDPELRRKVEALLEAHDGVGDFLEEPLPGAGPGDRVEAPGEKPGDRIGRYRLLQQIGEGGCGVVYMAEQEEPVRRRVALKIIKPGMDTKSVIARFEAERQALALMDHPSIAKVFDAGATESGRPYFVMELIRGTKITEYCDQNALSTKDRLQLFVQVCQAVQHAHQKGIIHRDLKPSNILVTTTPECEALPVVIDFGIAKATTNLRLTDKTLFTAFEMLIGTPAYMSPEQTALTSADVDTRTDIYSLGVLLYELLTGSTPFDAGELLKAGLDEVRRVIREQEPPRPSARLSRLTASDLTTVAHRRHAEPPALIRSVRGDLDWIVMRALEKDRARRYETANGLALDVQRYLGDEVIAARPPSRLYRLRKMIARNRVAFFGVVILLAVLVVSLIVVSTLLARARQARQDAEASRHQAEADKSRAQTESVKSRQVTRFLEEMLQGVGPSAALGRDTTMLREVLDKAALRLNTELTDQPATRGDLRARIGGIYMDLGLYAKAEEIDRAAIADFRKADALDEAPLASALANLASMLVKIHKLPEAETTYREALAIQQRIFGPESALAATTMKNLAGIYFRQNRLDEANVLNEQALAIRQKLFGHDHLDTADSLNGRAAILVTLHKLAEAEAIHREVLAIRRTLLPADHPLIATSLSNLGLALQRSMKLSEAESILRESIAIRLKLFGKDHPDVITTQMALEGALARGNKLAEAEAVLREVLPARRRLLGAEHPDTLQTQSELAKVLHEQGKEAEAETLCLDTLPLLRKGPGKREETYAKLLETLGNIQFAQGRMAEAEATNREVVASRRQLLGAEHPDTLSGMTNLARVFRKMQRFPEAESLLRETTTLERKFLDSQGGTPFQGYLPENYAISMGNLAAVLAAQGKTAEAEAVQNEIAAWRQKLAAHKDADPKLQPQIAP
jgi:serine/threonine protein kinase/tetratricopeptide (TPR) repeat protein